MRDIIQRTSRTDDDREFFERWDERKARIAAAKRLPADGHKRRTGKPRAVPDEERAAIVEHYIKSGNQADTARHFRIDRKTVSRFAKQAGVTHAKLEKRPRPTIEGVETTTYLDYAVYKRIKTLAHLNSRSMAAEIRAALLKLYG